MKQTKKLSRKVISYVLAMVMVFSTMTGIVPGMSLKAYADELAETIATNTGETEYTGQHFKIVSRYRTADSDGIYPNNGIEISSLNDEIIKSVVMTCGYYANLLNKDLISVSPSTANVTIENGTVTISNLNTSMLTFRHSKNSYGTPQFNNFTIYYAKKTAQIVTAPTAASDLTYKKKSGTGIAYKRCICYNR